jgi:hypothetical protein
LYCFYQGKDCIYVVTLKRAFVNLPGLQVCAPAYRETCAETPLGDSKDSS